MALPFLEILAVLTKRFGSVKGGLPAERGVIAAPLRASALSEARRLPCVIPGGSHREIRHVARRSWCVMPVPAAGTPARHGASGMAPASNARGSFWLPSDRNRPALVILAESAVDAISARSLRIEGTRESGTAGQA
ncbi:MAG: hypothetical protein OXH79_14155 [Boseongicola sp.]|nr:hypothetical protein [Boseongicola sp.]